MNKNKKLNRKRNNRRKNGKKYYYKYYYKLVVSDEYPSYSFYSLVYHPNSIVYYPGEWIKANIGKIFIFKNIEDAKDFKLCLDVGPNRIIEIWQVEARGVKKMRLGLSQDLLYDEKVLRKFWNLKKIPVELLYSPPKVGLTPPGTMVASSVRLIKRIE